MKVHELIKVLTKFQEMDEDSVIHQMDEDSVIHPWEPSLLVISGDKMITRYLDIYPSPDGGYAIGIESNYKEKTQ